jgi:aryl sulfotransferase
MEECRRYFHPFLDSDRWKWFEARDDDIIIATPFKSGTTWVQMIVMGLIHGIQNPPLLRDVDHWIEFRLAPVALAVDKLKAQTTRRFIKTHLPFDAIKYDDRLKYIVVDRDPRDVFMSLWNHYHNMNLQLVNCDLPSGVNPIPNCPMDIREFWRVWLTKGYFPWEQEGYPFWSNLRHAQSWFDVAGRENVLHVHYKNLLEDNVTEIRRIANFIGLQQCEEDIELLSKYTSFENTKNNLHKLFPGGYRIFKNGPNTFFNKGTNGRWKKILDESDVSLFYEISRSILDKYCLEWLVSGVKEIGPRNS